MKFQAMFPTFRQGKDQATTYVMSQSTLPLVRKPLVQRRLVKHRAAKPHMSVSVVTFHVIFCCIHVASIICTTFCHLGHLSGLGLEKSHRVSLWAQIGSLCGSYERSEWAQKGVNCVGPIYFKKKKTGRSYGQTQANYFLFVLVFFAGGPE